MNGSIIKNINSLAITLVLGPLLIKLGVDLAA